MRYALKYPERKRCKLAIPNNPKIVQGLMNLEIGSDHVSLHLMEGAGFNKGRARMFAGVPGNLEGFVCRLSFQRGFEGNVSLYCQDAINSMKRL